MAPGGEMFRYSQHFGENVLPRGSHEWLPYSVDAVRAEIVKHQFVGLLSYVNKHFQIIPEGDTTTVHCQLSTVAVR